MKNLKMSKISLTNILKKTFKKEPPKKKTKKLIKKVAKKLLKLKKFYQKKQ
jgi:CarD family transcriptional regulator